MTNAIMPLSLKNSLRCVPLLLTLALPWPVNAQEPGAPTVAAPDAVGALSTPLRARAALSEHRLELQTTVEIKKLCDELGGVVANGRCVTSGNRNAGSPPPPPPSTPPSTPKPADVNAVVEISTGERGALAIIETNTGRYPVYPGDSVHGWQIVKISSASKSVTLRKGKDTKTLVMGSRQ